VGLVVQSDHPTDGKKFVYRLTEKGADLAPTLAQLALWGAKYFPDHAAPEAMLGMMRASPDRLIGEVRARVLAEQSAGVRAAEVSEHGAIRERRSQDSGARRRPTATKRTRSGKMARADEARPLR
ncbi:MAG: winged helix-turn-helix transcriptional regulator, partial [Verrucomicrobiales bacterium]|nr:winged helix-turn-helix transcriptional regulator [Verrucomicrobiales bacterium]